MARRRALVASAPTRLDFGGGWTDVPPFPEERGGFVCNVAIDRRAVIRLTDRNTGRGSAGEVASPSDPLIAAALRHAQVSDIDVTVTSDFPVGAGLGGSSAAGVALAAALHAWRGRPEDRGAADRASLAEWSREVEVNELGIAGGRQDHYAAAFGGALGLTFGRDTTVDAIALTPESTAALEHRCLLAYTGESRISATTITAVLDAYRDRVPHVLDALDAMKALALEMRHALGAGDIEQLGRLVGAHWIHQRALHPAITTPRIDAIEAATRAAGSIGMKALGASGGGCVMVFAPTGRVAHVSEALATLSTLLPWRVAPAGVTVRED